MNALALQIVACALRHRVHSGSLTLRDVNGNTRRIESGSPGPDMVLSFHDRALPWQIMLNAPMAIPEAYMDQRLTIEGGALEGFLRIMMRARIASNREGREKRHLNNRRAVARSGRAWMRNTLPAARRNVAHHYDLSDSLYAQFLDQDWHYSCAYFAGATDDLETAQRAKDRHIAAKLALRPGQRVLDIGCGWGSTALYLARLVGDLEIVGITLSKEQLIVARRRAAEAGLAGRVRFHLQDYRTFDERFDRIYSIGMFEHVGVPQYPVFFDRLRAMLNPRGVALVHSIVRLGGPGVTAPWLRKYIFPGGYSPALSEVLPHIETAGLRLTDLEVLREHYAKTLRHWRRRFAANRDAVAALYDERFCRMWELYLTGSQLAFELDDHAVGQFQIAGPECDLPLTRDYIARAERTYPLWPEARAPANADDRHRRALGPAQVE